MAITLWECRSRIGDRVVYTCRHGREEGSVESINDRYVFVLYDGDQCPKATYPSDLEWVDKGEGS
jgi:hypothetical protein